MLLSVHVERKSTRHFCLLSVPFSVEKRNLLRVQGGQFFLFFSCRMSCIGLWSVSNFVGPENKRISLFFTYVSMISCILCLNLSQIVSSALEYWPFVWNQTNLFFPCVPRWVSLLNQSGWRFPLDYLFFMDVSTNLCKENYHKHIPLPMSVDICTTSGVF